VCYLLFQPLGMLLLLQKYPRNCMVSSFHFPLKTAVISVKHPPNESRTLSLYLHSSSYLESLIPNKDKNNNRLESKSSIYFKSSTLSFPTTESPIASKSKPIFDKLFQLKSILGNDPVLMWRALAITFISSLYIFHSIIDANLVRLWQFLRTSPHLLAWCFRHDHWEWQLAIYAFFVWIHGFWICDRLVQKAAEKGVEHPLRKYRLQDQFDIARREKLQAKRRNRFGRPPHPLPISSSNAVEKNPRLTKQSKWHLGFWIFELPLYVLPLYIWDKLIPRREAKIIAWHAAPTTFQLCRDVTGALLIYDMGFFVCHFLMHKIPFLYKFVHKKHHKTKEVRASDIVRLSGVEEVVDVGISILALNHLKCHPLARSIYNVIITFLLTELHSGFAFPWTPQFVVPFGLSTGSKGHHYHHRNGKHYYQKFFCTVDRLFGFVDKEEGKTDNGYREAVA